jgi:hypothetical protein
MEDFPNEIKEDVFHYPRSVKVGVFVFSFLAVILVVWQTQSRLRLVIPTLGSATSSAADQALSILELEDAQLRDQDSDQDGLSDYQELRVYGTSPFIADSDSDGKSDSQEVNEESDPNCPEGQDCGTPLLLAPTVGSNSQAVVDQKITDLVSDPAEIRKLLKNGGADPELIDSLDDQSLQALASQALEVYQEQVPQNNIEAVQALDQNSLKQLLVGLGISQAELDAMTSEQLDALIQSISTDSQVTQ